jgi:plasmid maintenance system antidote protein VapI
MEVLTPNQKIKKIMQVLKITQEKLAGETLNRSYISKIINNKEKLYDTTAIKIANAINSFLEEENQITYEWLLEDENAQINRICDKHIEELAYIVREKDEKQIMDKLLIIKGLNDTYEISDIKKLELIDAAYLALRSKYKFDIALDYIELYKEIALSIEEENVDIKYSRVLTNCRRLTFTLLQLKEYHSIVSVSKNAIRMAKKYDLTSADNKISIIKITRNLALAYKNIGDYDKCISCLETLIKNYELSGDDEIYSYNLIAKCYIKLNRLQEAESKLLYIEKANRYTSDKQIYTILENLCLLYLEKDAPEKALRYESKLLKISLDGMDKIDKARNLYYLLIIETNLGKQEKIEEIYKECFDLAYTLNDETMQYKLLLFTAQYYINENMRASLSTLFDFLKKNFKKIIANQIENILNEISEYFRDIDKEKREEVIQYATRIRRTFTNFIYDI